MRLLYLCRYPDWGNTDDIKLDEVSLIYKTGELSEAGYQDVQLFRGPRYIRVNKIENYGVVL